MIAEIRSDRGSGPPLLYVPGIDGSGRMLLGTEERLARRFRLVCLGYRVAVGSPAGPESYRALAASAMACAAELGLRRVALLAESFGGAVALQAALDHSDRVAGLAIVNGFAWYRSRLRLWLARAGWPLLPKPLFSACRARLAPYSLFGRLREEAAVRALCSGQLDFAGGGYGRRLRMIAGLDLRPRLGEIHQPVALFAGDCDRIVAAVRLAREMQRALPDAELTVIEGGGHLVLPLARLPWEEWLAKLCERAGLSRGAASRGDDLDG